MTGPGQQAIALLLGLPEDADEREIIVATAKLLAEAHGARNATHWREARRRAIEHAEAVRALVRNALPVLRWVTGSDST